MFSVEFFVVILGLMVNIFSLLAVYTRIISRLTRLETHIAHLLSDASIVDMAYTN